MGKDGRDQCKRLTFYFTEKRQGGQGQKGRKQRKAQPDIIINMKATYFRIARGTGAVATEPPPRPSDSETTLSAQR
jgi:hypothetical protein